MLFKEINGLEEVKDRLINAVKNGKVAHAQMFLGKPGSPNLPLALAFATYLNCENKGESDACGVCASCTKIQKYVHPDLHFVYPVSSTKNVSGKEVVSTSFLKEWRQFLISSPYGDINAWANHYGGEDKQGNISKEESRQIIKNLSLKSFEGSYKIMIIWLPEYMHPSAANGILKILEEPPEDTVFLLVSSNADRLLTTILSRTQIVTIPKLSDDSVKSMLIKHHQVEEAKAGQLAHLADGDYNAAVKLLQSVSDDSQELFSSWMRDCFKKDFTNMVLKSDQFHAMNKTAQKSLLQYGVNILRESLIASHAGDLVRVSGEEAKFVENFSKVMDVDKVEKISKLINTAHYHLERNAAPKITFLDLSLNIAAAIR